MKFLIFLSLILFSTFSFADTNPVLTTVKLMKAYIPSGYDSNDNVQMVVEGWLSDTCYKVGPVSVKKDIVNKVIEVKQFAYRYSGICLQMIVPYRQTISLGILDANTYEVRDGANGGTLGTLPVKLTTSASPDDYLYAPVAEAELNVRPDGITEVGVTGTFYDSCMRVNELRPIIESDNVLTVLPIASLADIGNCHVGNYPFKATVKVSGLKKGRYLLNVRSMNGQAVTKLFDTFQD